MGKTEVKLATFLQETAWVLYALYFRPVALKHHLGANVTDLPKHDSSAFLSFILDRLNQAAARRYLVIFFIISLTGLGLAAWNDALGPLAAAGLALAAGLSTEPGRWLTLLFSPQFTVTLRLEVSPGLLIGLGIGVLVVGGE